MNLPGGQPPPRIGIAFQPFKDWGAVWTNGEDITFDAFERHLLDQSWDIFWMLQHSRPYTPWNNPSCTRTLQGVSIYSPLAVKGGPLTTPWGPGISRCNWKDFIIQRATFYHHDRFRE